MYIADIKGKVQHIQDENNKTRCGLTLLNSIELGIYLDESILPLCKKCADPKDKYLKEWQYIHLYPYSERFVLEDEFIRIHQKDRRKEKLISESKELLCQ